MKESFRIKHPYMVAILVGLLCTVLTGIGMTIPQIKGMDDYATYLFAAVTLIVSSAIGVFLMSRTKITLKSYGFQANKKGSVRLVWWYLPLLLMEVLPVIAYGLQSQIKPYQYAIIAFFAVAVGLNEEIYFRGIIFSFLKHKGSKQAIFGSAFIFGFLHIANAFGGKNWFYLILQISFAFLVGIILAQLISITKSLWVGILWHACHDFIAISTDGELDTKALILLSIQVLLLLIYAVGLWKLSMKKQMEEEK